MVVCLVNNLFGMYSTRPVVVVKIRKKHIKEEHARVILSDGGMI